VLRDEAESATQRFRDECHAAGVRSHEAVIDEADKALSVVRHAHRSDLVLLTQARSEHQVERDLVEEVVLYSARPTLIVPNTGRFEHVGNRVLVAWDDSCEAARALSDALPILCHSSRVELVRWREGGAKDNTALQARLDALYRWLQCHGVAGHVYLESPHGPLADAMLSRAGQIDADLIVMGAYSHPRWAQRMMGGATRGMLAAMTTPVLMSH
jgi:nucleotide-binding universal stress UspA family protein